MESRMRYRRVRDGANEYLEILAFRALIEEMEPVMRAAGWEPWMWTFVEPGA